MTGNAAAKYCTEYFATGLNDYLSKLIDKEKLQVIIFRQASKYTV